MTKRCTVHFCFGTPRPLPNWNTTMVQFCVSWALGNNGELCTSLLKHLWPIYIFIRHTLGMDVFIHCFVCYVWLPTHRWSAKLCGQWGKRRRYSPFPWPPSKTQRKKGVDFFCRKWYRMTVLKRHTYYVR
jgi:hypothetical protein